MAGGIYEFGVLMPKALFSAEYELTIEWHFAGEV
jgi:hypothetical protein